MRVPKLPPCARPPLVALATASVLLLLSFLGPTRAEAQLAASGFELALHGNGEGVAGKTTRFRGIAYRVRGVAQLEPLGRAQVRARVVIAGTKKKKVWREMRADQRGFFQIDVPMPKNQEVSAQLEIAVGDGSDERVFEFPLRLQSPWTLDLVTDRALYEPGETIHAWARLRDSQSRRPLANTDIRMTSAPVAVNSQVHTTGNSGVASMTVRIPKEAEEGTHQFVAEIDGREITRSYRIGTRTYERLFATMNISPETAAPHEPIEVVVKVSTASGTLVRNAEVEIRIDSGAARRATTDSRGMATLTMRTPSYMTHATGAVSVAAHVTHPAHGETNALTTLGIEVPRTLTVEAVPSNAALVPELPGLLYVRLSQGGGKPAKPGTPISVSGAAIVGGRASGKTDKHGFVTVPTRLPTGAAIGDHERASTTVLVHVEGDAPRTASIDIAVARLAEVVPSVDKAVVSPAETISVKLARRTSAKKVPVVVELRSEKGLVEARVVPPGVNRLRFKTPGDRLGVMTVLARPLHQTSVVEGTGSIDAFLVRPANPFFPTVTTDKKVYPVGGTANLTLQTGRGSEKRWASVLVRDLAAHSGERPFRMFFLARAFDKALIDSSSKSSQTLLRTALADHIYMDSEPTKAPDLLDALGEEELEGYGLEASRERGVLRDPFPLAEELERRGVGKVMREMESLLSNALIEGRLSDVTIRRGNRSEFRSSILEELGEHPLSLGEKEISLAMLYAVDSSFRYDNVARRVARRRLIELLVALAVYLDPGDDATPAQRGAAREPSDRWLSRMVERGLITADQLSDPWGSRFSLRRTNKPAVAIAIEAASLELVSPGPDGKLGTRDDVANPFARAVPAGTVYAVASGEDRLMAALARLAPGAEVLRRLLQAYKRVTAEVAEEAIGDAVGASVSEGWGTIGTGSYGTIGHGSGTGSGYGSGSGRLARRASRAPKVRVGSARASGGVSGFARVVRERFPSTLLFAPVIEVSSSGSTSIPVALSDAVTTYLAEVVVWSADGWTWSTQTQIRVDKEIVVDAPVPEFATVGDVLRLPLRVGNRSSQERSLDVSVFTPGDDSRPQFVAAGVRVPAKDTAVTSVELKVAKAQEGHVTVGVRSAKGVSLDAVKRPIKVQRSARRVRKSVNMLASANRKGQKAETLRYAIPKNSQERDGSQLHIRVGAGLFDQPTSGPEAQWSRAWDGEVLTNDDTKSWLVGSSLLLQATAIGVVWNGTEYPDSFLAEGLRALSVKIAKLDKISDPKAQLRERVTCMLALSPVVRNLHARVPLDADMEAVLTKLRKDVQATATQISDDPKLWAMSAAALALTASESAKLARVRELVRRVRRHQLVVGQHTWIAARDGVHETSAYLSLAELKLGERKRALALLRTIATLITSKHKLSSRTRVMAKLAAQQASSFSPPRHINLYVDGKKRRVALQNGVAIVAAPEIGTPGEHALSIDTGNEEPTLFYLEAVSEFGLPWDDVPEVPGSIVASIDGAKGRVGARTKLELVVRNRSPRTIAKPVVQVSLPAGAELDKQARQALRRHSRGYSEANRGTLVVQLAGLPPGGVRKIPIEFRWSVGGKLQGLGLASYPAGQPENVSVTKPRVLDIASAKETP